MDVFFFLCLFLNRSGVWSISVEVIAFVHVLAKTSVYTRKHVWQRLSTVRLPAHRPLKERPVLAPTVLPLISFTAYYLCLLNSS